MASSYQNLNILVYRGRVRVGVGVGGKVIGIYELTKDDTIQPSRHDLTDHNLNQICYSLEITA